MQSCFRGPGPVGVQRSGTKKRETIFTTLLSIHHFDICASGTWPPLVLNISSRPNLDPLFVPNQGQTGGSCGELKPSLRLFTQRFPCAEKCKWGVDADHTAASCTTRPEEPLSHTVPWAGLILHILIHLDPCAYCIYTRRNIPVISQAWLHTSVGLLHTVL